MGKRLIILSVLFGIFFIGGVCAWADDGNLTQNVDGCNVLNTTNATYTLTSDVNSSGTCFNVTAENVTLDCDGYWINYSLGGIEEASGVYTNRINTTIKKLQYCKWKFICN